MAAFDFDDWGRWGIDDCYTNTLERLKAAIDSGESFDTGWHGFAKTFESLRVVRDETRIEVLVHAAQDEVFEQPDLITDCLTCEEETEVLTDDMIDQIRDELVENPNFFEETVQSDFLPPTAKLHEIVETAKRLCKICHEVLGTAYRECIATTLYAMYGYSEKTTAMIKERIAKLCFD